MISLLRPLLLLLALGATLAPTPARAAELAIAAAANLKYALDELVAAFHGQQPGVEVKVTYGSSGNFYAQLSQRAPFDLFLSADTIYPGRLVADGRALDGGMFRYATGRLALWVPPDSTLQRANRSSWSAKRRSSPAWPSRRPRTWGDGSRWRDSRGITQSRTSRFASISRARLGATRRITA